MFRPKEAGTSANGEDSSGKKERRKPLFTKTHRMGSDGSVRLMEELKRMNSLLETIQGNQRRIEVGEGERSTRRLVWSR